MWSCDAFNVLGLFSGRGCSRLILLFTIVLRSVIVVPCRSVDIARTNMAIFCARFTFGSLARTACLPLATCQTRSIDSPPLCMRLPVRRDKADLTRWRKKAARSNLRRGRIGIRHTAHTHRASRNVAIIALKSTIVGSEIRPKRSRARKARLLRDREGRLR